MSSVDVSVTGDYDAILASVGELGLWHWLVLLALVPPALLPGMWSVLFVFSGYVVRYEVVPDHHYISSLLQTPMSRPWL